MTLAEYQDLCLDAHDALLVGRFWAAALGAELEVQGGGDTVVRGPAWGPLWVNVVPEPKVAKNRVHLDVRGPSADPLIELGATVVAANDGWTVLADPEGNELCWFPGEVAGPGVVDAFAICVDSAEPEALAAWWQSLIGGEVQPGPDGTPRWIHGGAGLGELIFKCVRVADERVAKNRCHWDVVTDDVAALVAAGATLLAEPGDAHRWTVLADPQGNEFCAFAR